MNRLVIPSVVLLFVAVGNMGCAIKKDFTFTVEKEYIVNQSTPTYASYSDVDLTQVSSEFKDHKDDISSLEIESATYVVTYFQGTATQRITTASIRVGATGGGNTEQVSTLSNVSIISVAAREQSLVLTPAGVDKMVNLFKSPPYSARLYLDATANETPLNFRIKLKFNVKATYKASII